MALLYCGVPIGGILVSLLGAAMGSDWRTPFLAGGILPIMLAVLLWRTAPAVPVAIVRDQGREGLVDALFGGDRLVNSLLIWTSFFATLVILYLVLNWLPILLGSLGIDRRTTFLAQLAFNLGGLSFCALTAPILDRPKGWLVAVAAFVLIPLLLWQASAVHGPLAAIAFAFCLGGAVLVTQSCLYAIAPRIYPTQARGIGVGGAVAAGRLDSIAGPLLGVLLISSSSGLAPVLHGVIPVAVVAAAAAILLHLRKREG